MIDAALCLYQPTRWAGTGTHHTRLSSVDVDGIWWRQLSVYVAVCVPPTKSREMLIEIRVFSSSYLPWLRQRPSRVVDLECFPDLGVSSDQSRSWYCRSVFKFGATSRGKYIPFPLAAESPTLLSFAGPPSQKAH